MDMNSLWAPTRYRSLHVWFGLFLQEIVDRIRCLSPWPALPVLISGKLELVEVTYQNLWVPDCKIFWLFPYVDNTRHVRVSC
jgi:hypothetical protein